MADERIDPTRNVEVSLLIRPRRAFPDAAQAATAAPLTREAFVATYGASPDDLATVEDFARSHGLQVLEADSGRRTVRLAGSGDLMSQAFGVNLVRQVDADGTAYRAPDQVVVVPAELNGVVQGVFGLDTRPVARRLG